MDALNPTDGITMHMVIFTYTPTQNNGYGKMIVWTLQMLYEPQARNNIYNSSIIL